MADFEPTIIAFVCNWCTYTAADLAGTARLGYPANVRLIRVMCTGMVDPKYVIKALSLYQRKFQGSEADQASQRDPFPIRLWR
jgi:hypothetical protein